MSLKCPYLAKIALNDIFKNANSIWKSADRCPFMVTAVRTLSDEVRRNLSSSSKSLFNKTAEMSQVALNDKNHLNEKKIDSKCPFINKTLAFETKIDENEEKMSKKKDHHNHKSDEIIHQFKNEETNSFEFDRFFSSRLESKKKDHTYRYFKHIVRDSKTFPVAEEQIKKDDDEKRKITIWCSNDYLGLGRHPYVKNEVINAVEKYGAGSGGTRNISGSTPLHSKLEKELAKLHHKESALVFTSCYVANDTTLFTLAKMLPKCHIFSDAGNHASMIQGIRNSGVPKHVFRHNDAKHLEELLKKVPIETPKIVAFESVHSMDGSICNIEEMCDITHKYGGLAFVDEVHAVGLYGENGAGVGERDNVLDKMDVISGTLGKAFGNVGGYIAGSNALVDTIRSYGSGFIFTTSLPPSVLSGSLASIKISSSDEGRELRSRHQRNAAILKKRLIAAGLPVMNSPSHIVPVFVGNAQHASDICNILLKDYGIYIQSINYPTVARGEERLRIVPTPLHTDEMIDELVGALVKVWTECDLKLKINAMSSAKKISVTCQKCQNEVNDSNWKDLCKNFLLNKQCEALAVC